MESKTQKDEQNRKRLMDAESKLMVARQGRGCGGGAGDWVEQVKGIKRYTLPVLTKMYLLLFSLSVVSDSL